MKRRVKAVLSSVLAATCALAFACVAPSAQALPAGQFGVFPTFATAPATTPNTFTGTATFPASANGSVVNITTDSTTVKVPSGETAFMGASTGFGQYFGSSRSQPYLYLSPSAGLKPSTTTLLFSGAVPANWGFALGDIDADWVQVVPLDAAGNPIAGNLNTLLGPQDTGGTPLLNYCANASPKPSSCTGPGPFTDAPWWLATGGKSPNPTDLGTYPAGSVVGNGVDTAGAYDWFLPSSAVHGIRLIYTPKSGFPIYQVWLAAGASPVTITGTVAIPDLPPTTPIPAGTTATLNHDDGTPVLAIDETPVTTPIAPNGTFQFTTEQEAAYVIGIDPPPGFTAPAPVRVVANAATASTGIIALAPTAAVPTPTASPNPEPALAATGSNITPWAFGAGLIVLLGALIVTIMQLRRLRKTPTDEGDSPPPTDERPENDPISPDDPR